MPELPEVETVVRTLEQQICNCKILKVEVLYNKTIVGDPVFFIDRLTGQHFRSFSRRGKYLLFYMDDVLFVSHLRMEGKYFLQDPKEPRTKHMHVIFHLDNGKELRYHDTRKFGRMEILPIDTDLMHFLDLGPEPFSSKFDADYVYRYRKNKNIPVKTFLLDQHFVAGIGNIYADEILFACGIRPTRNVRYLTKKDDEHIVYETKHILKEAIQAGGTTIRSYTSSLGVTGRFQLSCKIHARKTCAKCGHEAIIKWIGGRSSYYCPVCQKK